MVSWSMASLNLTVVRERSWAYIPLGIWSSQIIGNGRLEPLLLGKEKKSPICSPSRESKVILAATWLPHMASVGSEVDAKQQQSVAPHDNIVIIVILINPHRSSKSHNNMGRMSHSSNNFHQSGSLPATMLSHTRRPHLVDNRNQGYFEVKTLV